MSVIEVAIGPGGMPGTFRVEVVDSPAGHLSAVSGLDVGALAGQRRLLQQEVLASAARSRGVPETEELLREAGRALFAGLLGADGVVGAYRASAALAAERGEELRVVLRIDDPALAGLPWEGMFDDELGAYVCRRDQLVRHVPVASVPAPLQVRPPLRILGVASSPRGLPRLDAEAEKDQLARALARLASQGLAEVHWAPDATWAGLQDMLMDGEWHVLHYVGHGDFDPDRDEGVLTLEREDGRPDLVSARRVVDLLRQARPMPRLVVLNSCAGAATGATDLFSGTAAALVRGGVPAVAAMQYKITDDAAIAFARGFYAAIARGRGVDDAVSSGRAAILGTSETTLEWVTPVLYLRGNQARLFNLPAPARESFRSSAATDSSSLSTETAAGSPARGTPSPLARTLLTGHTDRVIDVAFSPDRRLLATASLDGTTRVWETATGRCLRTLTQYGEITGVTFSPDGQLLATASLDPPERHAGARGKPGQTYVGTVRLWDAATGRSRYTFGDNTPTARSVAFSPDGRLLATAGIALRVWDTATGQRLTDLGYGAWRAVLAFSPAGRLLASAAKTVHVWDTAAGKALTELTSEPASWAGSAVFSRDGRLLATGHSDSTARVWDTATGRCLHTLAGLAGAVSDTSVLFSPDGRLLSTTHRGSPVASGEAAVRVWDVVEGRCLHTLTGHDNAVFGPDGRLLAAVTSDSTVQVYDAATGRCLQVIGDLSAGGWGITMVFSLDGKSLLTVDKDSAGGLTLTVTVVAETPGS